MKVKYIALGAILTTGILFASCSGNKNESNNETADAATPVETEEVAAAPTQKTAEAIFADYIAAGNVADTIIHTTPTGLKYIVLTEGTGKSPIATDIVKVHYEGTLPNGTVFDSSIQRGEPISFPLQQVIKGWTEGLQLMKEGGKTVFYIPSDLAYGPHGAGPLIGPDQDLVFVVDLLEVNPKEAN